MITIFNINELNSDNIVEKKWGREIILHNDENYCGKLLQFNKGAKFSMHFHIKKIETFYVNKGKLVLKYIDTKDASTYIKELNVGDVIEIEPSDPHQIFAEEDSEIIEISTQHFDSDSYRIDKGDNQR
jgi:mannose-6-phosphate isomerase-like protein (cupin superfamily)